MYKKITIFFAKFTNLSFIVKDSVKTVQESCWDAISHYNYVFWFLHFPHFLENWQTFCTKTEGYC